MSQYGGAVQSEQSWARPRFDHTSDKFVAVVRSGRGVAAPAREVVIITANLSADETSKGDGLLRVHPNVPLRDTPAYASELNHVELWCAKVR